MKNIELQYWLSLIIANIYFASDKEWFENLPNFTPEIFEEITGINVAPK